MTPFARVVRFSEKHVEVKVIRRVANYRWTHYFGVAKHLLIRRSETVNSMFDLEQLEEKYLMTYKGVGRGTSVRDAREKLGAPDYTQYTQSPGWYNDYYFADNVNIFYQNMAIHSITRDIPDYIKKAAGELRAKEATEKSLEFLKRATEPKNPDNTSFLKRALEEAIKKSSQAK